MSEYSREEEAIKWKEHRKRLGELGKEFPEMIEGLLDAAFIAGIGFRDRELEHEKTRSITHTKDREVPQDQEDILQLGDQADDHG